MTNAPALLNNFQVKVLKLDRDVIIGEDIFEFGPDLLLSRMHVSPSLELIRLRRLVQHLDHIKIVKNTWHIAYFKHEVVAGRLVLDTYTETQDQLTRDSRLCARPLSKMVTSEGRNTLQNAVNVAGKLPMPRLFTVIRNVFSFTSD